MQQAVLGSSGIAVSRLCLGSMTFGAGLGEGEAITLVRHALDLGLTFFDTGNTYAGGQAERILGEALRQAGRSRAVLATKVYFPTGPGPDDRGLSRAAIHKAIDASLLRLGTDYVDLYIAHRWDPLTPIEETLEALDAVVRAGKARAVGASSMSAWQFERCLGLQAREGWSPFVCMQSHLNLLYREEEREMLPLCRDRGVAVTAWSPLARGLLTQAGGAARPGDRIAPAYQQGAVAEVRSALTAIAEARGRPCSEVALAWLLGRADVAAPVLGATGPEHLSSAAAALDLVLTREEIARLEAGYRPMPIIGHGVELPA